MKKKMTLLPKNSLFDFGKMDMMMFVDIAMGIFLGNVLTLLLAMVITLIIGING